MPPQQTLEILRARSSGIHTMSAAGSLRLTRPDGESVGLDSAVVLQAPDRARVRAWKFGQAVFDLTVTPDGLYLVAPKDSEQHRQLVAAGSRAGAMIRDWLKLATGAIEADTIDEHADKLIARRANSDGTTLVSTIDRRTITARSFILLDASQHERFSLALDRYIESNGQVWPTQIEGKSADGGELRLQLRDVEVNGELPPNALQPPARAEKLP